MLFHTSNLWDLVRPYDARTWGENVAYADTLRRVEELWMQSHEHRINLLNPSFRSAGHRGRADQRVALGHAAALRIVLERAAWTFEALSG